MSMPFQPLPCPADDPVVIPEPCCSPGIASTGLCLGDGTPIAVMAVSACAECGGAAAAPVVSGWINLLTGSFTAGPPPAGSEPCLGQPQQFEVGQWCDLDANGDVIAPVLTEYEYDDQGQLIGVRTLTPAGDPYVVAGTLGLCPQAVGEPQYVEMCDVQGDGSVIRFFRGFTPNGDGTANPDDIDVDGNTYTPTGTVGACEPCASSATLTLCDAGAPIDIGPFLTFAETSPAPYYQAADGVQKQPLLVPGQPFWDGGSITVAPPPGGEAADPTHRYTAALIAGAPEDPPCGYPRDVTLTLRATVTNTGPNVGQGVSGRWHLHDGTTTLATQSILATPVGVPQQFEISATVPYATLLDGTLAIVMDLETQHAGVKSWTAEAFEVTAELAPQDGCGNPFLRTIRRDCVTGDLLDVIDSDFDGNPYTAASPVGPCDGGSGAGGRVTGKQIVERCGCDDANGDGSVIVRYVELWAVDTAGVDAPELLGTWVEGDFDQPYTPANPVDCPGAGGSGPILFAQHANVTSGAPWTLAAVTAGRQVTSVTYTVVAGTGSATDSNGTVLPAIPAGFSATWSNDDEGALSPPVQIAADPGGRVLVHWTEGA